MGGYDWPRQQVQVSTPSRNQKRRFVFDQRPFERQARGDKPAAAFAVEFFFVAFFHVQLHHRRQPPAKPRGKTALGEFHAFESVAVENREKPEQVAGVIHHRIVQNYQVLVGAAAAHVNARLAFGAFLHAWHELQHAQHVFFSQESGYFLDLAHGNFDLAHLHVVTHAVLRAPLRHHYFVQSPPWHEADVEFLVFVEGNFLAHATVAHKRKRQRYRVGGGQRERVKPVGIGTGANGGGGQINVYANEQFLTARFPYVSAYGVAFLGKSTAAKQQCCSE